MVIILNSNEEAIEVTNLKVSASQWGGTVNAHKVESSVSESIDDILSRKDELENFLEHTTWPRITEIILDICEEFHDKFYLDGDKLSRTGVVKHSIPSAGLDENRVINITSSRLLEAHKKG